MTRRLTLLAAVATAAVASPVLAQTMTAPPTTTETTTTTQPTAAPPAPSATETTTTQSTTTPSGQPATTTQTTTTETQPTTTPDGQPAATTTQTTTTETQVIAATKDDLKSGAEVYDQTGASVGKIDKASAEGAIVNTGKARADIPLASFGKNEKGLVVTITKADIDSQAKAEKPKK